MFTLHTWDELPSIPDSNQHCATPKVIIKLFQHSKQKLHTYYALIFYSFLPPAPAHMLCSLDSPIFTAETQEAIKVSSTWQSPRTRWRSPGSYKAFINKMTPSLTGLHNGSFFPPTEDPRWGEQPVDCYSYHRCQNILRPLSHPESSFESL